MKIKFIIQVLVFVLVFGFVLACNEAEVEKFEEESAIVEKTEDEVVEESDVVFYFKFPLRLKPEEKEQGYFLYLAQKFGNFLETDDGNVYNGFHSGEDWHIRKKQNEGDNIGTNESAGRPDDRRPIYAIGPGKVLKVSKIGDGSMGMWVLIEHTVELGGRPFIIPAKEIESHGENASYGKDEVYKIYSAYGHLDKLVVKEGDKINNKNTIIGYIKEMSGPHLHFEIRHPESQSSGTGQLAGDPIYWQIFTSGKNKGKPNGYYTNLKKMVEINDEEENAGFRCPSDFIEANSKISITVSEEHEEELLEENSKTEIGRIVFESERDGNWEIYVMNSDGSGQINLTNNPEADFDPFWSPDGKRIAFVSWRDGNREIYVMNSDGSKQINLTNNPAADGSPTWSPDGKKIAFDSDRDGYSEIYVMNSDGSEQTNLTNSKGYDYYPTWSPDGKKIAFENNFDIYVMNADGSVQNNLTNNPSYDWSPAWSPDGKKIAFESKGEIYVMNVDGSGQINLTNNPEDDRYPVWSPDGTLIAFESRRDGNREIYVMNSDGSEQTNLTNNSADDSYPIWSPDGKKIAFTSYRDGNHEIYVMNADGSEQTNLTKSKGQDRWSLNYSPYGKMISF